MEEPRLPVGMTGLAILNHTYVTLGKRLLVASQMLALVNGSG